MCEYKSRTEGRLKKHIENFHSNTSPEQLAANKQKKGKMPAKPKKFTCKTCGHETPTKVLFFVCFLYSKISSIAIINLEILRLGENFQIWYVDGIFHAESKLEIHLFRKNI